MVGGAFRPLVTSALRRVCAALLACAAASASAAPESPRHARAELWSALCAAVPGQAVDLALRLTLDRGWHTYWQNPGDSGEPARLEWTLPPGVRAGPLEWPVPERIPAAPFMTYGYHDEVVLPLRLALDPGLRPGTTLTLAARARYLVCREVCLPEQAALSIPLRIAAAAQPDPAAQTAIARARAALPRPVPELDLRAGVHAGRLYLRWRGAAPRAAYFFPADGAQVEHAAPQVLHAGTEEPFLALVPARLAAARPARLVGVLQVEPPLAGALTAAAVDAPVEALETAPRGAPVQPGEGARALAAALVLALAGGLILNLMPCVFPVLAIKAAGIAGAAGGRVRAAGLAYGAGVLASLWALAAVLLVLRAGGQALGWGFQLQSAPFVAALVLLMTAVGVNLLGAYEAGIGLAARAGGADRGTGLRGAFFSGVLATALATPCTAPFMAAALGYALAQPAPAALAVFTALGLGLAAPFLLLAEVPGLATRLPRPGPWMARLRQGLAFPMLAAALWLAWVYTRQRGPDAAALLLGAALALAFGLWAWGFVQRGRRALPLTGVAAGGALAAVLLALALRGGGTPTPGGIAWAPWSAAAVAQHRADGRPVFVDFTADWCLTCKVNERVALADARVARAFAAADVAALKADWTAYDPAITAALAALGRSGVPVYVYYPPGAPGRVLPELLTPGIVLRALEGGG